jgi:hypothetical protein
MLSLGMLALAASASHAQYTFDPSAADELDKPGVMFFGVAKDENGKPVADVLVLLEDIDTNFTLVTNELGRYRAMLPVGTTLTSVSATCSKPGYVAVRVAKRPGAKRSTGPTVQVDCLLRRKAEK